MMWYKIGKTGSKRYDTWRILSDRNRRGFDDHRSDGIIKFTNGDKFYYYCDRQTNISIIYLNLKDLFQVKQDII